MIDVKQIAKPKQSSSGGGSSSTSSYSGIGKTTEEAKHAAKADSATFAEQADYANRAGYASRAAYSDLAGDVSEDSPINDRFLSKVVADIAQGHITLNEGLTALGLATFKKGLNISSDYSISEYGEAILRSLQLGAYGIAENGDAVLNKLILDLLQSSDYDEATQTGFGFYKRKDGKYGLNITDLFVWGKALFNNLEIRNLYSVGGSIVLSPSSGRIVKVDALADTSGAVTGWKCYLLADDGTMATTNQWQVDDQARCQTFNVASGVYENVSNRNYWRRITEVSTENEEITDADGNVLYDGQKFAWVKISKEDCMEGSDEPQADDTIVCMGNRTNTERQSVQILSTVGEDAPSFSMYRGVNSYTLTKKCIFNVHDDGVDVVSKYFNWTNDDGDKIWTPTYLGTWTDGTAYSYYDEVTWMGTRWLCIVAEPNTTTDEPSEASDYWRATTNIYTPTLVLDTDLLQTGIAIGETHNVTCHLMLGDKDVTQSVQTWEVSRKTDDTVSDKAWATQDKVKNFKGSLDIVWSNDGTTDDIGEGDTATFTFKATTTTGKIHEQYISI